MRPSLLYRGNYLWIVLDGNIIRFDKLQHSAGKFPLAPPRLPNMPVQEYLLPKMALWEGFSCEQLLRSNHSIACNVSQMSSDVGYPVITLSQYKLYFSLIPT